MPYHWLPQVLATLTGVEPHEVMQALASHRRLPRNAVAGGITVLVIFARANSGRPLAVVTRPAEGFDRLIVGAREMTPGELAVFEKWEATR